jgi:hypothetical protein
MGSDQDARQVEQLAQDSRERFLAAHYAGFLESLVEYFLQLNAEFRPVPARVQAQQSPI